jgi:hypothetical protein
VILQVLRILIHTIIHMLWIKNIHSLPKIRQPVQKPRNELAHYTAMHTYISFGRDKKEIFCSTFLDEARLGRNHTEHGEAPLPCWTDYLVRIY